MSMLKDHAASVAPLNKTAAIAARVADARHLECIDLFL
jgi:hypothetical protein